MLHLLSHIIEEQLFQCVLLGIVGALAIPIDGAEFLLQGGDGKMEVQRFCRKTLAGSVQVCSTFFVPTGRYSYSML